ncbi:STN domain-containing protein, partial [Pseudomonas aegrilactucae]
MKTAAMPLYRPLRLTFSPLALALSLCALDSVAEPATTPGARQQLIDFDLPAGPLDATLTAIARHSGRGIAFSAGLTRGLAAPALRGRYSAEQAVQQALQ